MFGGSSVGSTNMIPLKCRISRLSRHKNIKYNLRGAVI